MNDLSKYIKSQLQNPAFKEEYDKALPELEITKALIKARLEEGLTQKQLSERTGIRQSNISRIENGTISPTMQTLRILANGLGRKLQIEFAKEQN